MANRDNEVLEKETGFAGEEKGWLNFLLKNLNWDTPVKNNAPAGNYTVWIQLISNPDRTVLDIT